MGNIVLILIQIAPVITEERGSQPVKAKVHSSSKIHLSVIKL